MAKQYTIYSSESFSDVDCDGNKITGSLYEVLLENGTTSETHKYFVRDTEDMHTILSAAVNALKKATETESKTSEFVSEPIAVE